MQKFKEMSWNGIILALIEMVVGILLMIDAVTFSKIIVIIAGAVLTVLGLVSIIGYLRTPPVVATAGNGFCYGLIALLAGVFCLCGFNRVVEIFPVVTVFYGLFCIISGAEKTQWTVDMLRLHLPKWYLPAIAAALSFVCGIIIIVNPFATTAAVWMFTGIMLVISGALDIVSFAFGAARNYQKHPPKHMEPQGRPLKRRGHKGHKPHSGEPVPEVKPEEAPVPGPEPDGAPEAEAPAPGPEV